MIRNRCVRCDGVIEAPDDRRGHEVACPHCEATNLLHTDDDAVREEEVESAEREQERERFLAALAQRRRGIGAPADLLPSSGWRAPIEVSSSNLALFASRKLREVSLYLLLFAYGLPLLALAIAVPVALWGGLPGVWSVVAFLGGGLLGVLTYLYFKFMSDVVRALADVSELARSLDNQLARVTELIVAQGDQAEGGEAASTGQDAKPLPTLARQGD